jgi:hypothetical protein
VRERTLAIVGDEWLASRSVLFTTLERNSGTLCIDVSLVSARSGLDGKELKLSGLEPLTSGRPFAMPSVLYNNNTNVTKTKKKNLNSVA